MSNYNIDKKIKEISIINNNMRKYFNWKIKFNN